jgi:hypothetical protein
MKKFLLIAIEFLFWLGGTVQTLLGILLLLRHDGDEMAYLASGLAMLAMSLIIGHEREHNKEIQDLRTKHQLLEDMVHRLFSRYIIQTEFKEQ